MALQWGQQYAENIGKMLLNDYFTNRTVQVVASLNKNIVGSVDLIVNEKIVELDNLFVLESYRYQGVATKIEQFVMKQFVDKTAILLAERDDTPKDMYRKQGFEYIGYYIDALNPNGVL